MVAHEFEDDERKIGVVEAGVEGLHNKGDKPLEELWVFSRVFASFGGFVQRVEDGE